jgi:hypothetical protein
MDPGVLVAIIEVELLGKVELFCQAAFPPKVTNVEASPPGPNILRVIFMILTWLFVFVAFCNIMVYL